MAVIEVQTRRESKLSPPQPGLARYLLLPRAKDLFKGWIIVLTYALGLLTTGQVSTASVVRAVLVASVVELLVYQARYQWNDVRGFVADQNHPSSSGRRRLPGPLIRARAHVAASCAVAAARLAITGVLIFAVPRLHLGGVLGFAIAGVFGAAIAYEVLRSLSTGQGGTASSPIAAGAVLLWVTVGAGYAVRGLVGLGLAVDLWNRPTLLVAAAVTLWCYGIAFVTCRWAVEMTEFAAIRDGRVAWQARADQAREHQLTLTRWIPSRAGDVADIVDWAPLRGRTSVTAPWNLAAVVAGGAAAITGWLLIGSCTVKHAVIIVGVGAVATLVAVYASRGRPLVVIVAALLLLGAYTLLAAPRPLPAVLPWLVLMIAYLSNTTRTLRKFRRPNRFITLTRAVIVRVVRLVVGRPTWEAMQRSDKRFMSASQAIRSHLWS